MSNLHNLILVSALLAIMNVALPAAAKCPTDLEVDISFSLDLGQTITDAEGTHHHFFGIVIDDFDQIYIPPRWGIFPLYFFGTNIGITVVVTNNSPSNCVPLNLWITNVYTILKTNGRSGPELTDPTMIEIMELHPGESKTYNASILLTFKPEFKTGLNLFLVKIYQLNKNDKGGKFLLDKEGIFGVG